jgi:chromosome segregation ATPase
MDIFGFITALSGISALIISILTWIKSAKLMPKEVKKADLENEIKEATIAEQYQNIITKEIQKSLSYQDRISSLEKEFSDLRSQIFELSKKVKEQEDIIAHQTEIIEQQNARLNAQQAQIASQEETINTLKNDLNISIQYSLNLINRMKDSGIVPEEMPKLSSIPEEQIKKVSKNKK